MGEDLREQVRRRYSEAAQAVRGGSTCCGPSGGDVVSETGRASRALDSEAPGVDWTGGSYSEADRSGLPVLANEASLGCGNPVALAELHPGETVLDLGSGGGIDVLLSARRVAPGGKAYGLDMTDEMLALARENRREAGIENAEFLKGEIEAVPLPDDHVDVVISNCVINLSTEKERALAEAFRVLKPGGRFAVSDMVFLGDKDKLPAEVVRSAELWAGCVSGALEKSEYEELLSAAGFEGVSVEVTHTYESEATAETGCCGGSGCCGDAGIPRGLGEVSLASAFVRARKPIERS